MEKIYVYLTRHERHTLDNLCDRGLAYAQLFWNITLPNKMNSSKFTLFRVDAMEWKDLVNEETRKFGFLGNCTGSLRRKLTLLYNDIPNSN